MAMKEDRQVFQTDISWTASGTMERGGIASIASWANGLVYYAAGSGQPIAGLLLEDIETQNYMNHPQYLQRNVSPEGSVVGLATEGEFWTDMIQTAVTYSPGDALYLWSDGKITNYNPGDGTVSARIGTCLAGKDSNNFIKIRLELT